MHPDILLQLARTELQDRLRAAEARRLAADTYEQLGYRSEAATWRNSDLFAAHEIRRGMPKVAVRGGVAPDALAALPLLYGLAGGAFFHWFYSGETRKYPFDFSQLHSVADQAAAAAGLDIFGGDVIVSASGDLTLIDLNDWPSFAPCRERAAYAIAQFITKRVHAS